MNKFSRLMDILDLFLTQDMLLTAEDIAKLLDVSRPTAFRYAKELSDAGLLENYSGNYCLGSRIISLDYRIRETDPLLHVAQPIMRQLASTILGTVVIHRRFKEKVINVHQGDVPDTAPRLGQGLGRGRPLPLFRGSAGKIMLANLPKAKIQQIYERNVNHPDVQALGQDWDEFWSKIKEIRGQNFYISIGEVNAETVGISAPVTLPDASKLAVLSVVISVERLAISNAEGIGEQLKKSALEISAQLEQTVSNFNHKVLLES